MGMHARVMRVELGDVDQGISFVRDKVARLAGQQRGIVAGYWLVDRANGRGLAVTIWESEEAMVASQAPARGLAQSEQQEGAVEAASLERYEVVAQV